MSYYHYALAVPEKKAIAKREKFLNRAITKLENRLETAPEGSLTISRKKGRKSVSYYHVEKDGVRKTYLRKAEPDAIRALAQKEYDRKALKIARNELNQLRALKEYVDGLKLEDASAQCLAEKQPFFSPLVVPDDAYREKWLTQNFFQKDKDDENHIFSTEKGDKVCSKTESMEADYMYRHGPDYLYEKRLTLRDHGRIVWRYPDFTLLDPVTREEVIFEHFGLVDDESYRKNMFDKIRLYEENGYIIGKNFLFTFETKEHPFTMDQFTRILKARFPNVSD